MPSVPLRKLRASFAACSQVCLGIPCGASAHALHFGLLEHAAQLTPVEQDPNNKARNNRRCSTVGAQNERRIGTKVHAAILPRLPPASSALCEYVDARSRC